MGRDWIVITCTKKYWRKHHGDNPNGILKRWDSRDLNFVHLKINQRPVHDADIVCVNVDDKLRGTFKIHTIRDLSLTYLRKNKLAEDFNPGLFILCRGNTWKRLQKEIPRKYNRGFNYMKPLY